MKKQSLRLGVSAALAIAFVATGTCLAHRGVLQASIPFAFEVGNARLPAGQYEINTITTGAGTFQTVRQLDDASVIHFFTISVAPRDRNSKPELVFHRYGNEYFLSQIWNGDGSGRQLIASRREKTAARDGAAIEIAIALR